MQSERNGETAAEHDGAVRGKREGEEKTVVAATDALNMQVYMQVCVHVRPTFA